MERPSGWKQWQNGNVKNELLHWSRGRNKRQPNCEKCYYYTHSSLICMREWVMSHTIYGKNDYQWFAHLSWFISWRCVKLFFLYPKGRHSLLALSRIALLQDTLFHLKLFLKSRTLATVCAVISKCFTVHIFIFGKHLVYLINQKYIFFCFPSSMSTFGYDQVIYLIAGFSDFLAKYCPFNMQCTCLFIAEFPSILH